MAQQDGTEGVVDLGAASTATRGATGAFTDFRLGQPMPGLSDD